MPTLIHDCSTMLCIERVEPRQTTLLVVQ
eukprot:SAG11_NODE_23468_length_388_cov_0.716263_1_plen_28_part_10